MNDSYGTLAKAEEKAIEKAFNFLELILSPPFKEVGLLARDQVKFWRFKNQVRIINKAKEMLDNKGFSPRKIPLKILYPLLEYGSLEEDENLRELWSVLLAKASSPESSVAFSQMYTEILRQLSPSEVSILNFMLTEYEKDSSVAKGEKKYDHESIIKSLGLSMNSYKILVLNLVRLNLIELPPMERAIKLGDPADEDVITAARLTNLGLDFVRHCR